MAYSKSPLQQPQNSVGGTMILSMTTYTFIHVVISLVGIGSGPDR